jgi:hypothetical protein
MRPADSMAERGRIVARSASAPQPIDSPRFTRARVTPARRRVLAAMADGEILHVEAGAFHLDSGEAVSPSIARLLVEEGLITEPLDQRLLFGVPARLATITECGRAALARRSSFTRS